MRTLSTQFPIAFAINLFCPWIAVSGLALRSGSCTGVSHAVSNSRVINRSYQILRLQPTQFTARYGSTTDDYFFVPLVELVQTVVDRPAVPKFGGSSGSQLEQLSLRNSYLGLRHGQSEANLSGVISSDPNVGTRMHGLTALGRTQAEQAATDLLQFLFKDNSEGRKQLLFVTSDFLRAKETATICMRTLQLLLLEKSRDCVEIIGDNDQPIVRTALRERSFGSYDGKDLLFYNHVWPIDAVRYSNNSIRMNIRSPHFVR